MSRHVFLTGAKHIGKSTVLKKVLKKYPGDLGGFFTVRTDGVFPGKFSVHLCPAAGKAVPGADNLLFVCRGVDSSVSEKFDHLGRRVLAESEGCSLLVMDELGPTEAEAALFRRAVIDCLDGETPVLGVLQAPAERFWPEVVNHPDVLVLQITEENRDGPALTEKILSILKGL